MRITREPHRRLAILAETGGLSLNEIVTKALAAAVGEATTMVNTPESTWQEIKARLETTRPKGKTSQDGGERPDRPKSTGQTRGHASEHQPKRRARPSLTSSY